MLREGERARRPEKPEWLGHKYPSYRGSAGGALLQKIKYANRISPEETIQPPFRVAVGLFIGLLLAGMLDFALKTIPSFILLCICSEYLGKIYAERLALTTRYGPFAEHAEWNKRGGKNWLHPQLLKFWVRSEVEHLPAKWLLNTLWYAGLLASFVLVFIKMPTGFCFGALFGPFIYLLCSGVGKDYSERQMMDEKYGY